MTRTAKLTTILINIETWRRIYAVKRSCFERHEQFIKC